MMERIYEQLQKVYKDNELLNKMKNTKELSNHFFAKLDLVQSNVQLAISLF